MSNHGHHSHKSHRHRSAWTRFIDRLTGRRRHRSHHYSEFPGINLPKDYDGDDYKYKPKQEQQPSESLPAEDLDRGNNAAAPVIGAGESRPARSSGRKRSLFKSFDLYLKKRELRKEERYREKMRRRHRRKSEQDYRRMNQGPGLGQRLLDMSKTEEEAAKNIPLFSNRSRFYRNLTIVVNSMMIYVVSYVVVYLFYWITCLIVASWYGLDSTLYYYDLKFNDHSPLWDRFNILLVTGIPPFLCFFLGAFLLQVVFKNKRFAGLQKLFILWSAFHLFNHFFGAFPSGVVTDEGFGYVAAWLYMNTAMKFLFSLLSLFVLGIIGYYSTKHILETSDSLGRIKAERKTSFLFYQMGIPWLAGTILLILLRLPHDFDYPYETLMLFSMAFLVIPPFFNDKAKPELNLLKIKKKRRINIGYLVMFLILLSFLRITLGIGLHFIIEIAISISPATT